MPRLRYFFAIKMTRRRPPELARNSDARVHLAVRIELRFGQGFSVRSRIGRIEVDDVAQQDPAVVELLPPDDNGLEGKWALAEPRDHRLAAGLDALSDGDLTHAGE
jgi:hypothetical protein